jgi:hypothetical protein
MQNSSVILYDSRFPLWFRIPVLVVGLFVLWLAVGIAAYGLFGVSLGIPMAGAQGSLLFGSLGCLAIAATWIFIWFAHLRISFDAARQELIVWRRGYLRWHEHHIALAGAREFHIRCVSDWMGGLTWPVHIIFTDGRTEHLIDMDFLAKAESLAESLRSTTKLPVTIRHDVATIRESTNAEIRAFLIAGTIIAGTIGFSTFFGRQAGWWRWLARLFCVVWLAGVWNQALREFRRRRRDEAAQNPNDATRQAADKTPGLN